MQKIGKDSRPKRGQSLRENLPSQTADAFGWALFYFIPHTMNFKDQPRLWGRRVQILAYLQKSKCLLFEEETQLRRGLHGHMFRISILDRVGWDYELVACKLWPFSKTKTYFSHLLMYKKKLYFFPCLHVSLACRWTIYLAIRFFLRDKYVSFL